MAKAKRIRQILRQLVSAQSFTFHEDDDPSLFELNETLKQNLKQNLLDLGITERELRRAVRVVTAKN
jgi:hypothetical protein